MWVSNGYRAQKSKMADILYNTPFLWLIKGSTVLILSESGLIRERNPKHFYTT